MTTEAVPTQPAPPSSAGLAAVDAFNRLAAELPAEPETAATTAQPATPVEPQTPPASAVTVSIPIEKIPEKFRSNPAALSDAYLNVERMAGRHAQDNDRLRRDNEALQARLAAAEQVNRMQPQPAQPQPNLSEMVITETPRFVETVAQHAVNAATQAAREAAQEETARLRQETQSKEQAQAMIATFEAAKELARKEGYQVTDQEWRQAVGYIAPAVVRENDQNPGVAFNPGRYVDHFRAMRGGPPKATIPTEGNPPVVARTAAPPASVPANTLTREQQDLDNIIRKALGPNAARK